MQIISESEQGIGQTRNLWYIPAALICPAFDFDFLRSSVVPCFYFGSTNTKLYSRSLELETDSESSDLQA